ncbi:MAG: VOC family protein [Verrucomicrobiales bacterium]|nr:VOC family protein [Verrucomicrobiales bacterium]
MSYPTLSAYLTVRDAVRAVDFYKVNFGAKEVFRLTEPQSGTISHAELRFGETLLMLAEENPAWNQSPATLNGTPVRLCLAVDDVDATLEKAAAAGATVLMPASDQFYGFRCGNLRDPFGHEWMIQKEIEKVSPEEMQRRWEQMLAENPNPKCGE